VNITVIPVVVNSRLGSGERFFRAGNGRQDSVFDVNPIQRFKSSQLLARDNGSDGISDVPHMIEAQGLFVLADGQNSILNG
jgi:hypothetical protein